MHRFFVEPEQIFPEYVEILGGDVNHIRNVLRMSPGDRISVSDGLGRTISVNWSSWKQNVSGDVSWRENPLMWNCLPV